MTTKKYHTFFKKVVDLFGVDLSVYEKTFIENSLQSRLNATGILTADDYSLLIEKENDEFGKLLALLNNSYSEFFRNQITYTFLEHIVIPRLFSNINNTRRGLRIWSAGCAAGQEPYSLAMLFHEYLQRQHKSVSCHIFATDSSAAQIDLANLGIYDYKNVQNIRMALVDKYFERKDDKFILSKKNVGQVDFSVYDLLDQASTAPPASVYGDFDLVMCCNVLFYYNDIYQRFILNKIWSSLNKNGIFITGEAEIGIVNAHGGFKKIVEAAGIFVKI